MEKVLAIDELVGESEDVVVSFEEVPDDPCGRADEEKQ